MNRSMTTHLKCLVPSCKIPTSNSRNKLFFRVSQPLKRKWCEELNIEYQPDRRMLCCEDHLNLEEDVENYLYYKLMNGRPILKSTAKLRRIEDLPSCSKTQTTVAEPAPTLKSLLLKPIENIQTLTNPLHAEQEFETAGLFI